MSKPTDIRQIILDELARQGKSRYWLAHNAGLTPDLIYRFLRGDTGTGDQTIGAIFDTLDLRIPPGDKLKELRRKARKR